MPGLKERAKTLVELFEASRFVWADRPLTLNEQGQALLTPEARGAIGALLPESKPFPIGSRRRSKRWCAAMRNVQALKLGSVAQPLRAALTGKTTSPPIFDVLAVLGRGESLARLRDRAAQSVAHNHSSAQRGTVRRALSKAAAQSLRRAILRRTHG